MKKSDSEIQIGVFSASEGSNLYEYKVRLEKIKNELVKFGLTPNQAKVYIYLGKYGPKSAPEIFKSLGLPRTETYYILSILQSRGIVTAEFSFPTRYMALPIEEAVSTLINTEKEKIDLLANQEKDLAQLWKTVPAFAIETNEAKSERLQMMEGAGQIYSKIKEMIKTAREQIIVFGSEKDISRFYHSEIIEMISNSLTEVKIILSPAMNIPDFFEDVVDKKKVRLIPKEKNDNRCFVIKDNDEVVLFLRNATHPSHNIFAIWSDSKSLIDSIQQLFDYSWDASEVSY